MDEAETKPFLIKDTDKCATIYRIDSTSFIYVCLHCGARSNDIDATLQHIESHFELVKITVDEIYFEPENKHFIDSTDNLAADTIEIVPQPDRDIKTETMDVESDCDDESLLELEQPTNLHCKLCDSAFSSKFLFRIHMLRVHFKQKTFECDKCGKEFHRNPALEKHLKQHFALGDVDWNCEGDGIRNPFSIEWRDIHENINQTSDLFDIQSLKADDVTNKKLPNKLFTYRCHRCPESCSTISALKDHLTSHKTIEMLQINRCKECETCFRSSFDLRLHALEVHISTSKLKCSSCSVEYSKQEKLLFKKHLKSHLANNTASWTTLCEGICKQGNDLTSFEDVSVCTEEQYSCKLCTEKFYLKSNLDEHGRSDHSKYEKEMHCPQCDSIFNQLKHYFAHQLEHQRVGATITETDINLLNSNLNTYIDEQFVCNNEEDSLNPYKCLLCTRQLNSPYEIRRHVRERHVYKMLPQPIKPNLKTNVTCNICGAIIKRHCYKSHIETHRGVHMYSCSTCGKTFRTKFGALVHGRLHTGEKPYQCDQCGKKFYSYSLMTAHRKCHDDTTYPCPTCGRVFNVPSGLRRHVQIHRKDKSFECTVCFKSFNTRVYLTRHMFKHSEKNFECKFCEEKFNTANGKRQHERAKHNYEPEAS